MGAAVSSEVAALRELARLNGIQRSYRDALGVRRTASVESLVHVLGALGEPVARVADARAALRARRSADQPDPVSVAWAGRLRGITGRRGEVILEDGGRLALDEALRVRLPTGYHRLVLGGSRGRERTIAVLSAPRRLPSLSRRELGVFVPLYSLHSQRSWGAGDLTDLRDLAQWACGKDGVGCGFVGTLPLLASYLDEPFEPSPYAPVSRLFWNEMYIDPGATPELARNPGAQRLLSSARLREVITRMRDSELVDYQRLMAAKRPVLEALSRTVWTEPSKRAALEHFIRDREDVLEYARFRAASEKHRKVWQEWPRWRREGALGSVDEDAARYHVYVQFAMEEQLRGVMSVLPEGGGLYLDLPIGVHAGGYDVWRHRRAFAVGEDGLSAASVGAPPDALFSQGQDWGFPPLHPQRSREDAHAYFAACLRHHFRFARVLRIDHVAGLHRLFWVPRGMPAREGAYVEYPADELYAVLSIEAHRALGGRGATVVGEDLGTVPASVNRAMARRRALGMYVGQFAMRADSKKPLADAPIQSLASLNTHDTPTFAGYLSGGDILLRTTLGLLDAGSARNERADRARLRNALSEFAASAGEGRTSRGILRALLKRIASSEAEAMLVDLEDLWLERRPKNVPGIGPEGYPSWRTRSARGLEEIAQSHEWRRLLRTLVELREERSALRVSRDRKPNVTRRTRRRAVLGAEGSR